MISGLFRFPFLLVAGAFATMDTTTSTWIQLPPKVIVDPIQTWIEPQSATVVQQDTASWLVSEFAGDMGCSYVKIDSLVPFVEGRYPLARLDWNVPMVKLDSATAAGCKKVKRYRQIDRLPTVEVQTFGVRGPIRVPYVPDTIKFCQSGSCVFLPTRKVRTPSASTERCLDAVARPFETRQQAIEFLQGKLAQSKAALRLSRRILIAYWNNSTGSIPWIIDDTIGKCMESIVRPNDTWPVYLKPLTGWNDPRIGADYAFPSPGNANDLYGTESLQFAVDTLFRDPGADRSVPVVSILPIWSYSTGVEGYMYRGATIIYDKCGGLAGWTPAIFADTLATMGENLLVTDALPQCGRQDVDGLAGTRNSWFALLPWTGEPLESVFRHYGSVETDWSWPMENDSILVRGQKVAIAELRQASGIANRHGVSSGFGVAVVGGSLSVDLGEASELRVMDASGQLLTSRKLAKGRSTVALPGFRRGFLVLQANGIRKSVVVP